MKKIYLFLLLLTAQVFSQNTPQVTVKDGQDLRLTDLKVHVDIVGNVAITTYDMQFYNGLNRTLEGELVFPLGEGQTVSGFAMDVNGKMRDAVIVEKELGRVAYETTIRRKIDPALLEKTEGNNYKARIYPIFPKKSKHIILKFEQQLSTLDGKQSYNLPLGIAHKLTNFSVKVNVFSAARPVVTKTSYDDFYFQKSGEAYVATISKNDHAPLEAIAIQIPNTSNQEHIATYNGYFHYYKSLQPTFRLKEKPKKITILWDASYSMRYRNLEKELNVLESYIHYLRDVKVNLIIFNNTIQAAATFKIKDGNVSSLLTAIKNVNYDGGTKLNLFEDVKLKADEILLFSDGLANLGDFAVKRKIPVYAINSLVSGNHQSLTNIATQSGGSYLNLVRLDHVKATQLLKKETYQFLGVKHNGNVKEVYPKQRVNVYQDFSISGQFSKDTTIELLFGFGGKVTEKIPVKVKKSTGTSAVKRLWAKEKLAALHQDKEANKTAIISLAKQYSLITDYTSMIILDRIQDYVRYKIEPPAELMDNYKHMLDAELQREKYRIAHIESRRKALLGSYKTINDWYDIDFTTVYDGNLGTGEKITVSGTIIDETGVPLPAATVRIKGTNSGVMSDFDGNYSVKVRRGRVLVFSYVGYNSKEVVVRSNTIDVMLDPAYELLDVVVTAYGVNGGPKKDSRRTVTGNSVSIDQVLQGQASGVRVSTSSESPSQLVQRDSIVIRGRTAIQGSIKPMYVVDGEVATTNTFRKISPNDIENMIVLKSHEATALYGNSGAQGVVVITTKRGMLEHKARIDAFNKKLADKIILKPWNANTPYIKVLEKTTTIAEAYKKYLEIRELHTNSPTFYLDVADFFHSREATEIAVTIITNLMEIELHNYELLKAAAYKLEYFERYEMAVLAYEKVLELRPEEPHSYRDLALAYEHVGEIQKSYDLLFKIYKGDLLKKDESARFTGIESIAYVELTRLVQKHAKKLKLSKEIKERFSSMPVDVRIVIDWNHNDTDIDLWVFDPNGEKAFYLNKETELGGRMSNDLRQGYGPEEFMLKNAAKGRYEVHVDHFSDQVQKISGPTILKVTMYTNYGKKNEQKKVTIVRLEKKRGNMEVGTLLLD